MAERDFAEIARLSERFNKDPKSRIFVQLADAYRKSSMIDEALDILNKGLQHHPDYPLAHLILGKCFFDKRMYEKAKESFNKTLSFDPQNIVALRMLAQACAATKDEQGQINAYKGLIAIDPFDAQAKEKLDELQSMQRSEPLHTIAMAEEYEKQGDLKKALEICEHLLFTDPTDIGVQQKIKSLKAQLATENKEVEETGIEELQVEAYFQPDQLERKKPPTPVKPEPPAPPEQKGDDVLQLDDFLTAEPQKEEKPTQPTISESPAPTPSPKTTTPDTTPEPSSDEEALDILQPFGDKPEPPAENIDILKPTEAADILQPAQEQAEPDSGIPPLKAEEPTPEPTAPPVKPETPEPAPPPLKAEEPSPGPEVPPLQPEAPEPEPTPPPLKAEEPSPEFKAKLKPDTTSTPVPEKEKPAETTAQPTEEFLDILEPIEEQRTPEDSLKTPEPPVESTTPQEISGNAPTPPEPPDQPDTQQSTEPPTVQETPPLSEEKQPSPEVPTQPPSPDAKPKEKPKEEDFQSFQDWLSGLLK